MRIGFISDLHITYNTSFLEEGIDCVLEAAKSAKIDKLFIAGDTSDDYLETGAFVERLVDEGLDTYFIFGNHEYWSLLYEEALKLNNKRYIHGKSVNVGDEHVVVGIDGFFDYSFTTLVDNESTRDLPKERHVIDKIGKANFDLKRNKIKSKKYREVFEDMEVKLTRELKKANKEGKKIILMLHYVPSEEFLLYKKNIIWDSINAFMGSKRYQELAEEYGVSKVVFGHTHFSHNKTINNVDYHCNPVGYKEKEFDISFRERVKESLKVFEV